MNRFLQTTSGWEYPGCFADRGFFSAPHPCIGYTFQPDINSRELQSKCRELITTAYSWRKTCAVLIILYALMQQLKILCIPELETGESDGGNATATGSLAI